MSLQKLTLMKFSTKSKFLFFLFSIIFTNLSVAVANVIVTQPTGGQNISNDKSTLGPSAGYTALGAIVIADQVAGDFAAGAGRTLTFNRPNTNWQFEAGVGSVTFSGSTNITAASIAVTATTITVTYTVVGTSAADNSLTISGINVQSTIKTLGSAVNITRAGGTGSIAGFANGTAVATLSKVAGVASMLQVLLPGQSNSPGSATGKTGGVTNQIAGTPFSVVVNAVDFAFNVVTTAPTHNVALTSPNPYFAAPANQALASGTTTFTTTLKTVQTSTSITATDATDGSLALNQSSNVRINVGAYVKLLVVLPGESLDPGSATGKTGTRSSWAGNVNNNIVVYAVDANWNRVTSAPANTIAITTTDLDATLPANNTLAAGGRTFTARLRTLASINTLKARDNNTGFEYVTAAINVVPGAYTKLQILLPGETSAPNTVSGKTGTPFGGSPPVAGTAFNVVVNAVDANWNLVPSVSNNVEITNNTAAYTNASVFPAITSLTAGTKTLSVTLNRAIAQTLRASDRTDIAKTSIVSSSILVGVSTYVKLLMLLPGETADPGTATGKAGTASDRLAGVAFNVSVIAVDAYWNRITTVNDNVEVTTTDPNGTKSATLALASGLRTNYTVTLRTQGITSLTATNKTNGAIIAYTNSNVNVISGGFVKLQILVPGETAAPGTATGKTGTPTAQTAGGSFNVIVNAVDAAWNVVNTVTDEIKLTSTDINTTLPTNANLVSGTKTFSVTLITGGNRTITANDVTNGAKTLNTSPTIVVGAGAYSKLLALLPSQTNAPGTLTGISGNPSIPARNTAFNIQIRAVDQYFNPVNGITNSISFASSDGTATLPAAVALVTNGYRTSSVNIRSVGVQTVTITDGTAGRSVSVTIPDPTTPSAASDHFRSFASGVWSDATTWESSTDGVTLWHAATLVPTSAANTINIRNTHVVEVIASVTVDQVTVASGAELVVRVGTLTVANGTGTDLQINGFLTGTNSGLITSTAGTTVFANGSKYQHKYTTVTGTIPTATWDDGSVCEISGYTSYVGGITNSNQTFSTLIWNCPDQNNAINGPSLGATFNAKNLQIVTTGIGIVHLGNTTGSSLITGNFTLTNGNVSLTSSGTKTLNIAGNVTLIDGTLTRGTAANVNFSGTSEQQFSNASTVISGAINFSINANAIVNFGTSVLDGSTGTFTLASSGTIITANADGLALTGNTGAIQTTGTRSYSTGANYIYNGTVAQAAGTGLPITLNNLTINNAQGVTLPAGVNTYTVNLGLSITGFLDMGDHPLAGLFSNTGTGTLKTSATTNAVATGKIWTVGIEYNAAVAQNMISGTHNGPLLTSGAGSKIGPIGILNVAGSWSSAGGKVDFATNSTSLIFNGSGAQSIVDSGSDGGLGLEFKTVTFTGGNTKTLTTGNFSLANTGVLTMGASTTLNANGKLTLRSGETSSGTIAAIPASSSITGSVNVERFINGGTQNPWRTFRMFSSPVGGSTYDFSQFIDDMIVTGAGGAASGFDATAGNGASAFTYNAGFQPVTNISTAVSVGNGVQIFFRGNRSNFIGKTVEPIVDPEDVTMDFEGTLNQQNVVVTLANNGNLVGNPYASSIDWNTGLTKTNLKNNIIRIWNPSARTYATYDGVSGTNNGSNVIPSGQGFFVEAATAGSASLTFTESTKINTQPSVLLLSAPISNRLTLNNESVAWGNDTQLLTTPHTEVRVTLSADASSFKEEAAVIFKSGKSGAFDASEDASYFSGGAEQKVFLASLSTDDRNLAINYMPEVSAASQVKLNMIGLNTRGHSGNVNGNYKLALVYNGLPTGYIVKLNDAFLGTTVVAQNGDTYNFSIDNAVPATFGPNRFSVSFDAPTTLAVTLRSFTASKVNEGVTVDWKSETEINHNRYELERAGDDQLYKKLVTVTAKGNGSTYSFVDKLPLLGNNYYRLVQVSSDSKISTTSPIVINYNGGVDSELVAIFPNPVKEQFTIKFNGSLKGTKQTVKITNISGQVLYNQTISTSSLTSGYSVNVGNYAAGLYMVEIFENGNQKVGQTKLIKE